MGVLATVRPGIAPKIGLNLPEKAARAPKTDSSAGKKRGTAGKKGADLPLGAALVAPTGSFLTAEGLLARDVPPVERGRGLFLAEYPLPEE
jgi:hypothetical protein